MWLAGLLALALPVISLYLFWKSAQRPVLLVRRESTSTSTPDLPDERLDPSKHNQRRLVLVAIASGLLLWTLAGRHLVLLLRPAGSDDPQDTHEIAARRIAGASGAQLAVREYGPVGAPRIVFTHGWGFDSREWFYARRQLATEFRVVVWDLPGLGESSPIPTGTYSLENLAADLGSVVATGGDQPSVLVGHSIGGMTNLTFARLFPAKLGREIAGIVQLNTTWTNPVQTAQGASINLALQKPVFEPMLHLTVWTSPLVRALNWLAYQSGLTHLQNASQSFAGAETREQLDFASKYYYRSSPGIVARGTLGMVNWDASEVLSRIPIPVLIISGEQDTTTLPSASDHMEKVIPSAERIRVSPAAHLGPIEQNTRYNEAIRAFAARCLAVTGGTLR